MNPTTSPIAVVTGSGARRVGHTVAQELASRGYSLVLHAHTSISEAQAFVEELTAAGTQAIAVMIPSGPSQRPASRTVS